MNRPTLRRRLAGALWCCLFACSSIPGALVEAKTAGDPAPDFVRNDLNGRTRALAAYRGKLVLLNFWATWCAPCLAEMPLFSEWEIRYGTRGLQVLGVSMDDSEAPVRALLDRHPVAYPILMGDAKLGEAFDGVFGLPLSYLIGPDGRILARYQGETDLHDLEKRIRESLPQPVR